MNRLVILSKTLEHSDCLAKDFAYRFKNEICKINKAKREFILKDGSIVLFDSYQHWNHDGGCRGRHDYITCSDFRYEYIISVKYVF